MKTDTYMQTDEWNGERHNKNILYGNALTHFVFEYNVRRYVNTNAVSTFKTRLLLLNILCLFLFKKHYCLVCDFEINTNSKVHFDFY